MFLGSYKIVYRRHPQRNGFQVHFKLKYGIDQFNGCPQFRRGRVFASAFHRVLGHLNFKRMVSRAEQWRRNGYGQVFLYTNGSRLFWASTNPSKTNVSFDRSLYQCTWIGISKCQPGFMDLPPFRNGQLKFKSLGIGLYAAKPDVIHCHEIFER